jgi:hypothetical protein
MQIYWTTKSIPELTQLSKGERERLLAAVRWKHLRHWQWWVTVAALIVLLALLKQLHDPLVRVTTAAVGGALVGLRIGQVSVHVKRRYLRALLEDEEPDRSADA